jgi:ketol-acid reductoisomerase
MISRSSGNDEAFLAAAPVMCETAAVVATIGVIGAGSWGTALAKMLAESGLNFATAAEMGSGAKMVVALARGTA